MSTKGTSTVGVIERVIPSSVRWQVWIHEEDEWVREWTLPDEKAAQRLVVDFEVNHTTPICIIRIEIPEITIREKK